MPTLAELAAHGNGLPFAAAADALRHAVVEHGAAVVEAPPGTGKTTLAPAVVAGCVEGRVLVTQPRRVAARAAARRLAQLTETDVGGVAGYTVRGERKVSRHTDVEMLTPGVLLRRLLRDPALDGVGAVILDEVHERGLDTDLLVALLREVRELREDLAVVAMSATVDAAGFAALLGGSQATPVVGVPGVLHPLEICWAPGPAPLGNAAPPASSSPTSVTRHSAPSRTVPTTATCWSSCQASGRCARWPPRCVTGLLPRWWNCTAR